MVKKRRPTSVESTFLPPFQTNQTEVYMEYPPDASAPRPEEFEIMTPSEEMYPDAETLEARSPVDQMSDPSMSDGPYAIYQ
jgi:hypothetical protein